MASADILPAEHADAGESGPAGEPVNGIDSSAQLTKFLGRYCIDCHNQNTSEGERTFDDLELPLSDVDSVIRVDEIVDHLVLRTMPPQEADQPSDQERITLIELLQNEIALARSSIRDTAGKTIMRRLSNREYENTLRALFGRRVDTLGLTLDFPKENTSQHIDTIGGSLVTSGFLLDQYFQAASRLIDMRLGSPIIEPQDWHFKDHFVQYEELTGSHKSVFNFDYLCLYEQPNTDTRQGGYGHIEDFLEGVPASGIYRIEVLAQAMHRDTHYDPKIFRIDFSEPFQLGVVPGDVRRGHIHYPQTIEPVLGVQLVPDENQEWLRFEVWLEAGQTPRFIFPNGPYESRASVIDTNRRYKDEFKNPQEGVSRSTLLREGSLPHIRIDEIKIHGPILEPDGRKEEITVFGKDGFDADAAVEQLFEFAQRAYRRPLNALDQERIQGFYAVRLAAGESPRTAALNTLKRILCSPSFLYLAEITDEQEIELNPYDLASRLSYSLWSEPPDRILLEAAKTGELKTKEQLTAQIDRLLSDDRSESFYQGFLDSWLNLRSLGDLPPPRKFATEYYFENLPPLMKKETQLFVRNLIEDDRPVRELLLADYTFANKTLAKLYGLPEKDELRLEDGFQKIVLSGNKSRGGLLAMASVLTVSANGVDTSPVTRGAWILENILGTPPPPPPDEVPSIDSDTSNAKTIREKLALHRSDAACNVCHRKIDPLGFPLEHFDPVGRWRQKYPSQGGSEERQEIDPSGELLTGEIFADYQEFRRILADTHNRDLTSCLARKLLEYSTGRHMERADEYMIDEIVDTIEQHNLGMGGLLRECLTSQIFRNR
ncbi:MAG: DUF1592 domain-containing protein [Rubripirellula sp.]|nr:DUF1592 domain-containing protein [Rubripirellula sp.]